MSLDSIPRRTREELETEFLTKLMRRDAKIWGERTAYATGGLVDKSDEADEKQDGVNRGNGHHAVPLDTPTTWTSYLRTRGWSS
jgi:hypothetical protein